MRASFIISGMISLNSLIFNGLEATRIEVQVQMTAGMSEQNFFLIGLPDRAVKESQMRVKNALASLNVSLPNKKLTINLAPSDIEKNRRTF